MNTYGWIVVICGTLLLVGVCACFYFGKDYLRFHKVFAPAVEILCTSIKGISGMLPNNELLKTLSVVLNVAVEAAQMAEKMWLDGTIDKPNRATYAKNYIDLMLTKAGIEITENIQSIIDGSIAFTCYLLPHSNPKEA